MATHVKPVPIDALGEEIPVALWAPGVSSPSAGSVAAAPTVPVAPDPEVVAQALRRRFSVQYKLEVLEQAERCAPGQLGALLRREGRYSSHLTCWRRPARAGCLGGACGAQTWPSGGGAGCPRATGVGAGAGKRPATSTPAAGRDHH